MNNIKGSGKTIRPENLSLARHLTKDEPIAGSSNDHQSPKSHDLDAYSGKSSRVASSSSETSSSVSGMSSPRKKLPLRTVPEDRRTLVEQEREVQQILKLDKDPVKALQKALQMPNFFKSQK